MVTPKKTVLPAKGPLQYRPYTRRDIDKIPQLHGLSADQRRNLRAVSAVLPFRVNDYVIEELIDWSRIPEDPIYQLTFPQPEMLSSENLKRILDLEKKKAGTEKIKEEVYRIQLSMNPHPAGQRKMNVPQIGERLYTGMQHKYRETVLFFPTQGQTCHAYCTYCFRWAQFVGIEELRFASNDADMLADYIRKHPHVSDVLFTGGDPMVMQEQKLRAYIEPLLSIDHLINIRIGTKALAYWPYRFTTDSDAEGILRLFERVIQHGKRLAIMAHICHPKELEPPVAQEAIRRVRATGAVIRSQAPIARHVNDQEEIWAQMWREQVRLGVIPYYMFVERDTGPKNYFEVPLVRCLEIHRRAIRQVSGLARTARGPSMSTKSGKIDIKGIATAGDEKVFILNMLQGRNPHWVNRPFFARFDPDATWFDQLRPAGGAEKFFFEDELAEMVRKRPTNARTPV